MFDTVRLSTETEIDPDKLKRRCWSWFVSGHTDAEGNTIETTCFSPPEVDWPFMRYYPASGTLKVECSLPKIRFDENVSLLSDGDVDQALDALSNRVADLTGADVPHCSGWNIRGRVDACFAWDTRFDGKPHVGDYLHAFKTIELPRHTSKTIDREATCYWLNGARTIRLYDKEKESGLTSAKGLLRFEVQLHHAKKELTDVAGVESLKARDVLAWPTARAVMQNYLNGLGADLVITDEEKLVAHLIYQCTATKAARLFGLVSMLRLYSRDELLRIGYKRNWLWRNTREINKAGANTCSTSSGLLPPLLLPGDDGYSGAVGRLA